MNLLAGLITKRPAWQAEDYDSSPSSSKDRQVQRSVSLKLDSKPLCGGRQPRDIRDINGNFELAHLLERAGSLNAKFMKEIEKEEERMSEWNRKPLPNWPSVLGVTSSLKDVGAGEGTGSDDGKSVAPDARQSSVDSNGGSEGLDGSTGGLELVSLPVRYRLIMLQKRRMSRSTHLASTSGGNVGEAVPITHTLGCLLEDDALGRDAGPDEGKSMNRIQHRVSFATNSSLLDRQRDAKLAIQWTHQEIVRSSSIII